MWCQVRESNPGHSGGRRAISPLRLPYSPISDYIWKSIPMDQNNRMCTFVLRRLKEQICLLCTKVVTKKDFKRKLTKIESLFESWIDHRKGDSGEGSLLTNILCRNCAHKNETVVRKILVTCSSKVELFPAPVSAETNTFLPDSYASTVFFW